MPGLEVSAVLTFLGALFNFGAAVLAFRAEARHGRGAKRRRRPRASRAKALNTRLTEPEKGALQV